jgi:hypothetical protein
MGLNVQELTKPSSLTSRAGVRPAAIETTRRPQDAAEGTQAHAVEARKAENGAQKNQDRPTTKLDETA